MVGAACLLAVLVLVVPPSSTAVPIRVPSSRTPRRARVDLRTHTIRLDGASASRRCRRSVRTGPPETSQARRRSPRSRRSACLAGPQTSEAGPGMELPAGPPCRVARHRAARHGGDSSITGDSGRASGQGSCKGPCKGPAPGAGDWMVRWAASQAAPMRTGWPPSGGQGVQRVRQGGGAPAATRFGAGGPEGQGRGRSPAGRLAAAGFKGVGLAVVGAEPQRLPARGCRLEMTTFDYILLGMILVSGLVGVLRGLIRELCPGQCGWQRSGERPFWCSGCRLSHRARRSTLAALGGRLTLFVGVLFAGSVVAWIVTYFVRRSVITGTDRVLGMMSYSPGCRLTGIPSWPWTSAALRPSLGGRVQAATVCGRSRGRTADVAEEQLATTRRSGSSVWASLASSAIACQSASMMR